jgi:hypothetical protein
MPIRDETVRTVPATIAVTTLSSFALDVARAQDPTLTSHARAGARISANCRTRAGRGRLAGKPNRRPSIGYAAPGRHGLSALQGEVARLCVIPGVERVTARECAP